MRRFIHTAVEEETENNKLAKAYHMMGNDVDRKSIANDPFTHLIKDALSILFADRDGVVFYPPDDETRELMLYLAVFFAESGFSTTSIAQFNALCECAAFEKRFARGNDPGTCIVTVEDVLESWWLLNKFDDLTRSKLTQKELKILRAIKEYNESHLNEELSATQIDVKKRADVGQSIISGAMSTRPNAEGKMGKLIELNYIGYDYRHNSETDRNVACYYLTPNGKRVISEGLESITIDKKGYEKICPTIFGKEYSAENPTKKQKEPKNVISVISKAGGYYEKDGEVVISKNGSQYDEIISNILISIKKGESGGTGWKGGGIHFSRRGYWDTRRRKHQIRKRRAN